MISVVPYCLYGQPCYIFGLTSKTKTVTLQVHNYNWHVLYTRPKFEKKILECLTQEGIEGFLPLQKVLRQWSDRKKKVEVPLFPSYVFANVCYIDRFRPLSYPGVVKYVSTGSKALPDVVPEGHIMKLKHLISDRKVHSVLGLDFKAGDKARITAGPLQGYEGYLIRKKTADKFVILVDAINRHVAVELCPQDVIRVNTDN